MKKIFPNNIICCSNITGFLDMFILKFFFNWYNFARLIFSCKKFQEMDKVSILESLN